jgi:hypothetical protein
MTQEELLARIGSYDEFGADYELVDVIRSVIRLHQPMEESETDICEECTRISSIRIKYPCRTIQVIQKELK